MSIHKAKTTQDFSDKRLLQRAVERIRAITGIEKITDLKEDHLEQEIIIDDSRYAIRYIVERIKDVTEIAPNTPLEKITKGIERYIGNNPLDAQYFSDGQNFCHDLEAFAPNGDVSKLANSEKYFFLQTRCNNGQMLTLLQWLHRLIKHRHQWPIANNIYFYLEKAKEEYFQGKKSIDEEADHS